MSSRRFLVFGVLLLSVVGCKSGGMNSECKKLHSAVSDNQIIDDLWGGVTHILKHPDDFRMRKANGFLVFSSQRWFVSPDPVDENDIDWNKIEVSNYDREVRVFPKETLNELLKSDESHIDLSDVAYVEIGRPDKILLTPSSNSKFLKVEVSCMDFARNTTDYGVGRFDLSLKEYAKE